MDNKIYIGFIIFILCIFTLLCGIKVFSKSKKDKKKNALFTSITIFTLFVALLMSGIYVFRVFKVPVLKLNGNEIEKIDVFEKYEDKGCSVDNKSLEKNVIVENLVNVDIPGVYEVIYKLNYMKKKISVKRKVIVEDNEKPVIELNGDLNITKSIASDYKENGYKATDNVDGDITDKVKITNKIENKAGEYEIIYEVEDSSGNKTSVKRNIKVVNDNNGVIYLTFDDGPSSSTSKILDILRNENVKATFFVVNYSDYYSNMIKRIVDEGHTIALHSYTHQYKIIYSSVESYYDDLYKLRDKIKNTTGVESNILRFPGGSSNTVSSFNKGIMSTLVKSVKERGFHYFDWNVDSRDAGVARNKTEVYNNVINGLSKNRSNVVLMHDAGSNIKTLEALPEMIKTMKNRGYTFSKITYDTPMVVHFVNN